MILQEDSTYQCLLQAVYEDPADDGCWMALKDYYLENRPLEELNSLFMDWTRAVFYSSWEVSGEHALEKVTAKFPDFPQISENSYLRGGGELKMMAAGYGLYRDYKDLEKFRKWKKTCAEQIVKHFSHRESYQGRYYDME